LIDKLFSSTDSQGHVTYCHQNKSLVVVHRLTYQSSFLKPLGQL